MFLVQAILAREGASRPRAALVVVLVTMCVWELLQAVSPLQGLRTFDVWDLLGSMVGVLAAWWAGGYWTRSAGALEARR
jgi:hypothetical protein